MNLYSTLLILMILVISSSPVKGQNSQTEATFILQSNQPISTYIKGTPYNIYPHREDKGFQQATGKYVYKYYYSLPSKDTTVVWVATNGNMTVERKKSSVNTLSGYVYASDFVSFDYNDAKVTTEYIKNNQKEKGKFSLTMNMSVVDFYSFYSGFNQRVSNQGVFGVGVGGEYNYSDLKSFSFGVGYLINSSLGEFIPTNTRYTQLETVEYYRAFFMEVGDNYNFHRFSFGYGLTYMQRSYKTTYAFYLVPSPGTIARKKDASLIGLNLNGYLNLNRFIKAGVIYRPAIALADKTKYEHNISVDVKFALNIFR